MGPLSSAWNTALSSRIRLRTNVRSCSGSTCSGPSDIEGIEEDPQSCHHGSLQADYR